MARERIGTRGESRRSASRDASRSTRSAGRTVYRLKIRLLEVKPAVWRRIEVPSTYNFWDLHVAIQDAMGWHDCHLHMFHSPNGNRDADTIGIPDPEDGFDGPPELCSWKTPIALWLAEPGDTVEYEYDFGDAWQHEIVLEEISSAEGRSTPLPRCLEGANACPPEDCGGAWGYGELLEILRDPAHAEHATMLEWLGGPFDPTAFRAESVRFGDPIARRALALGR